MHSLARCCSLAPAARWWRVYKDRALALPPLNTTLARRMMEQTRIFEALEGVRGRKPVDTEALERLLVRFSQLVVEQRWIKEIDINPLLASPAQIIALDARIVLHDPDMDEEDLPRTAIRPYPTQVQLTLHAAQRVKRSPSARFAPRTSR
jgi:acetyltransferase